MILTNNVLQRILCIRNGDSVGTAFTIDHVARQYIVTARHVVDGIASGGAISVRHEQRWAEVPITVVGLGDGDADVAVLAHAKPVTPSHPLSADGNFCIGQAVAFPGFPFGWDAGAENMNHGFPFPFVKAGIVSAIVPGPRERIYIDAHGNPGFSGAPLIVRQGNRLGTFTVAGVIADSPNDPITGEHAGFVGAVRIKCVLDLIDANPVGAPLLA
ncbi:MAG: trypsin-like peptidase domain-containing protein [Gemmatimonadetes bacterium]|nr:trypsin-like peptidase domain-containing protein [Gemmatimonadota bacterium]MYC91213.1 trypsin-like peptidase domain-containing protein [Gemmatimonadota bacterium]MYJ18282.1 trypsin-like peptidase domain-containing protein [Gemmatimonadota bacterium]